jgi:hypothetical protein
MCCCLGFALVLSVTVRVLLGLCFCSVNCQLTVWVLPRFYLGSAWFCRVLHGFCLGLLGFFLVLPGFGLGSTLFLCDFCLPCLGFCWGFRLVSVRTLLAFLPISALPVSGFLPGFCLGFTAFHLWFCLVLLRYAWYLSRICFGSALDLYRIMADIFAFALFLRRL